MDWHFFGIAMTIAGAYGFVMLARAFTRRLEGGTRSNAPLLAELDDLRARVTDSERLEGRMAELEERLDFAERMLAQQRDPERLSGGSV